MSLLPLVLFILGVIVLIWALKMDNTKGSTSPELLATLKGLASVKRELNQIQKGLREVEARMEDHELRILRTENAEAEIRASLEGSKLGSSLGKDSMIFRPAYFAPEKERNPKKEKVSEELTIEKDSRRIILSEDGRNSQELPEKYRWVLELSHQGWSVAEIAGHLAISQDAVQMILRTAQRGGQS